MSEKKEARVIIVITLYDTTNYCMGEVKETVKESLTSLRYRKNNRYTKKRISFVEKWTHIKENKNLEKPLWREKKYKIIIIIKILLLNTFAETSSD